MEVMVNKSGDNLWIVIPKPIAAMCNLSEGSELEITPQGNSKFNLNLKQKT